MTARLIAEEGPLKDLVLSLEEGEQWIIGRDPDACQLLLEDSTVSRKHLLCHKSPDGFVLENLAATNPVYINDKELIAPRLLRHGDAIKIGATLFRFYAESEAHLFEDLIPLENMQSQTTPEAEDSSLPLNPTEEQQENKPLPAAQLTSESEKSMERELPQEEEEEKEKLEKVEKKTEDIKEVKEEEKEKVVEEEEDIEERHNTIFDEQDALNEDALANINFDMLESGRWLLKVVGGPHSGAEFSLQTGTSYILGTDPNSCDIVFHDKSVSRQHARLTVAADDALTLEDLKSRNGTRMDGELVEGKRLLSTNTYVALGTTAFIVYDREGEMQTIISPLMPSIVKVLQQEEIKEDKEEALPPVESTIAVEKLAQATQPIAPEQKKSNSMGTLLLIAIITGLFIIIGIGTQTLFQSKPVVNEQPIDVEKAIDEATTPFPSVKHSFNKSTGRLLLLGHVLTATDKNQLEYNLQGLRFIKDIDDSAVIIDEYVWNEANQTLARNPNWKGVTVHSPIAGHFLLSGYLKTRLQAEQVWDYITRNFAYLDLLENKIIVEEDLLNAIESMLSNHNFSAVKPQLTNGELTLSGNIATGKSPEFEELLPKFKSLPGVRSVKNFVTEIAPEEAVINISDKYQVMGSSIQTGGNLTVVIGGRILSQGDILDGMKITEIKPGVILLEKEGISYRITFNR